MSRTFVCDLNDGDVFHDVLLVREKQIRTNRNGGRYLQLELDDRSGSISGRHWNSTDAESASFNAGDFLLIDGKVQVFQGQFQLIIHSFRRLDPESVRLVDFLPSTDKDVDQLESQLREMLRQVKDPALQAIAHAYLMDDQFMLGFRRAPAGVRNHHAYLGGLLEHVVSMMQVAERISDLYPHLNHDMLRMGIFLHDSGKVRELSFDRVFGYSDEGQLVGHLVQGVEMLNEKISLASEILGEPIPAETVSELKHLILSHHGTYEFGSPKLPMTPEAIALHHLDNLDAKVHNFSQKIRDTADPASKWSAYDNQLGRRIYRGSFRSR